MPAAGRLPVVFMLEELTTLFSLLRSTNNLRHGAVAWHVRSNTQVRMNASKPTALYTTGVSLRPGVSVLIHFDVNNVSHHRISAVEAKARSA